jgi:hypothetical protein
VFYAAAHVHAEHRPEVNGKAVRDVHTCSSSSTEASKILRTSMRGKWCNQQQAPLVTPCFAHKHRPATSQLYLAKTRRDRYKRHTCSRPASRLVIRHPRATLQPGSNTASLAGG